MHTKTITNPKTGRSIKVKAWTIDVQATIDSIKAKTFDPKKVSWSLLNDEASYQAMVKTEYGDQASSNFALSVFEYALDWRLGLTVLDVIRTFAKDKKRPKPFEVACDRKGNLYAILASGTVWVYEN